MSQGNVPPPPRSPTPPPPPPPPPLAAPSEPEPTTISRAPVRYTQPEPPSAPPDPDAMDEDEDEYVPPEPTSEDPGEAQESEPRSNRPGQKGFAARLMAKYGWSKGQGLGAEASGILQPLRVQVEKRKKKSDAEGGGWAEPGGRGRIIGSKTGGGASQSESGNGGGTSGSKFGPMSNVVVLRNMLEGMEDLQAEMESGLGQEIGEECGDKYGRVERLYIDIEGRRVYIKFTDQVSALRVSCSLAHVHPYLLLLPFSLPSSFHRKRIAIGCLRSVGGYTILTSRNQTIGSQRPGWPHIRWQHDPTAILRRRQVRAEDL